MTKKQKPDTVISQSLTSQTENLIRIQDLKARRERTQEQLKKANTDLFMAKETRDTILLALYAIDNQIDLLEEGQIPMFGDEIDE